MKSLHIAPSFALLATLAVALAAGATELVWQPRLALDTNTLLTLAFNNTRAVVRSRDGQRVYLAWKSKGASNALRFALLTNNAVASQTVISTNAAADALTVEETPAGTVVLAHTLPGAVIVLESTNHGASFATTATNNAAGPQANPSLSYSQTGDGYLIWHSATAPTVLYGSIKTNGAAGWSAPAVLESDLENPQFAAVWARGAAPVAVWRADANPAANLNWNIRLLDWTNATTPVTLPTTNCFDPSVFRLGDRTIASWFNLDQKINFAVRTNVAADFGAAQSFPAFGRFPHVLGNARGVVANYYEYADVQAPLTDDSVKKIGLMVSFDHGASFANAVPADLTNATYQIVATGWVSDGWLDLLWIDRVANVLRFQSAGLVYPPEISGIARDGTNAVISFFASASKTYSLEQRDALDGTNWNPCPAPPVAGGGREQTISVELAPTAQRFFRLVQECQ